MDVIELPLPAEFPSRPGELVQQVLPRLAGAGLHVFCEITYGADWLKHLSTLSLNLARWRALFAVGTVGLKVRCGGATAAVIPTPQELANFITCCKSFRVPWKATAGLHHPLRHRDRESGAMMHGFLNVFAAGMLAHVHAIDQVQMMAIAAQIATMLEEEAIDAFRFTDDSLRWRDWECTAEQIRAARRWVLSFGSCSFDEPRDELRWLGLLP